MVEIDMPYLCQPYNVAVDKQGAIWIVCMMRSTLARIDPDTRVIVEYPQPAGSGGIARELREDLQGIMWYVEWYGRRVRAPWSVGSRQARAHDGRAIGAKIASSPKST